MGECVASERVVEVRNLTEYFRDSIESAVSRQRVSVDPHATHYVVNLLTLFSRSEELYEDDGENYGLRPLALMLARAAEAPTAAERTSSLQRIGDVALFVSGFFADSLANNVVDIDYYVRMGGTAYGSLADEIRGTTRGQAFADVYRELATNFQIFVDVLHEVREGSPEEADIDAPRAYELWLKTGSDRAASLLRQQGVVPIRTRSQQH